MADRSLLPWSLLAPTYPSSASRGRGSPVTGATPRSSQEVHRTIDNTVYPNTAPHARVIVTPNHRVSRTGGAPPNATTPQGLHQQHPSPAVDGTSGPMLLESPSETSMELSEVEQPAVTTPVLSPMPFMARLLEEELADKNTTIAAAKAQQDLIRKQIVAACQQFDVSCKIFITITEGKLAVLDIHASSLRNTVTTYRSHRLQQQQELVRLLDAAKLTQFAFMHELKRQVQHAATNRFALQRQVVSLRRRNLTLHRHWRSTMASVSTAHSDVKQHLAAVRTQVSIVQAEDWQQFAARVIGAVHQHSHQHAEQLAAAQRQINAALKMQQGHADELASLRHQMQEQAAQLQQVSESEAQAAAATAELKRVKQQHADDLAAIRRELEAQVAAAALELQQGHADELASLRHQMQEQAAQLQHASESEAQAAAATAELKRVKQQHADDLAAMRRELEAQAAAAALKLQQVTQQHADEMDQANQHHANNLAAMLEARSTEAALQLQQVKQQHADELAAMQRELEAQTVQEIALQLEQAERRHCAALEQANQQHANELAAMRRELEAQTAQEVALQLEQTNQRHTKELEAQSAVAAAELQQVKQQHADEMEQANQQHTTELAAMRRELEAQNAQEIALQLEQANQRHANALAAMLEAHTTDAALQLQQIKEQHADEMTAVQQNSQEQILQLTQRHAATKQELEETAARTSLELQGLADELSSLRLELHKARTTAVQSQHDVAQHEELLDLHRQLQVANSQLETQTNELAVSQHNLELSNSQLQQLQAAYAALEQSQLLQSNAATQQATQFESRIAILQHEHEAQLVALQQRQQEQEESYAAKLMQLRAELQQAKFETEARHPDDEVQSLTLQVTALTDQLRTMEADHATSLQAAQAHWKDKASQVVSKLRAQLHDSQEKLRQTTELWSTFWNTHAAELTTVAGQLQASQLDMLTSLQVSSVEMPNAEHQRTASQLLHAMQSQFQDSQARQAAVANDLHQARTDLEQQREAGQASLTRLKSQAAQYATKLRTEHAAREAAWRQESQAAVDLYAWLFSQYSCQAAQDAAEPIQLRAWIAERLEQPRLASRHHQQVAALQASASSLRQGVEGLRLLVGDELSQLSRFSLAQLQTLRDRTSSVHSPASDNAAEISVDLEQLRQQHAGAVLSWQRQCGNLIDHSTKLSRWLDMAQEDVASHEMARQQDADEHRGHLQQLQQQQSATLESHSALTSFCEQQRHALECKTMENAELLTRLVTAQGANTDLLALVESLRSNHAELESTHIALQEQVGVRTHQLTSAASAGQVELQNALASISSLEVQRDAVQAELDARIAELAQLAHDVETEASERAALQHKLAVLEHECAQHTTLQAQLSQCKQQLQQVSEQYEERLATSQAELDRSMTLCAALERDIDNGKEAHAFQHDRIAALAAQCGAMQEELAASRTRLEQSDSDRIMLTTQLAHVQGQVAELTARKCDLEAQAQFAATQHQEVAVRLHEQIAHLVARNNALESGVGMQMSDLCAQVDQLSAQLSERIALQQQLQGQVADLAGRRGELEAELEQQSRVHANKLQAAACDRAALEQQVSELQAQITELTARRGQLETELDHANAQLQAATGHRAALEQQVSELDAQVTELTVRRGELETELGRANAQLQATAGDRAALEQQLQGQVTELTVRRGELETELDRANAQLQATACDRAALEQQVSELQGQVTELTARRGHLETELDHANAQLRAAAGDRAALEQQLQGQVTELTVRRGELETELDRANAQLQATAGDRAALEQQLQGQVTELTARRGELETELDRANAQLRATAGDRAALERQVSELQGQVTELTARRGELETELDHANAQLQAAAGDRASLEQQLQGQVTELTARHGELETELKLQARAQSDERQAACDQQQALVQTLQEVTAERVQLQAQVRALEQVVAEFKQHQETDDVELLTAQNARLQAELDLARAQLAHRVVLEEQAQEQVSELVKRCAGLQTEIERREVLVQQLQQRVSELTSIQAQVHGAVAAKQLEQHLALQAAVHAAHADLRAVRTRVQSCFDRITELVGGTRPTSTPIVSEAHAEMMRFIAYTCRDVVAERSVEQLCSDLCFAVSEAWSAQAGAVKALTIKLSVASDEIAQLLNAANQADDQLQGLAASETRLKMQVDHLEHANAQAQSTIAQHQQDSAKMATKCTAAERNAQQLRVQLTKVEASEQKLQSQLAELKRKSNAPVRTLAAASKSRPTASAPQPAPATPEESAGTRVSEPSVAPLPQLSPICASLLQSITATIVAESGEPFVHSDDAHDALAFVHRNLTHAFTAHSARAIKQMLACSQTIPMLLRNLAQIDSGLVKPLQRQDASDRVLRAVYASLQVRRRTAAARPITSFLSRAMIVVAVCAVCTVLVLLSLTQSFQVHSTEL